MYVDCGKCPACQQRKADLRALRIVSNNHPDYVPLFIHLTYMNECCPYVKEEDLQKVIYGDSDSIPVYRDYKRTWLRKSSDSHVRTLCFVRNTEPIDSLDVTDEDGYNTLLGYDISTLKYLRPTLKPRWTTLPTCGKIGICYYKDCQNFIKNLRQILIRKYNYDYTLPKKSFSFYQCSEYGSIWHRPHFHLLLWCPVEYQEIFKNASLQAWTYAFRDVTKRELKPAIAAASYASTYVNKPADFPKILQTASFREKHSYSQGFGVSLDDFSFAEILKKVRNGNLVYSRKSVQNGVPVTIDVPIPAYVVHRFFPRFKGFSRIPPASIRELALDCHDSCRNLAAGLHKFKKWYPFLNYDSDDVRSLTTYIYHKSLQVNLSICDYLLTWLDVHRVYASTLRKHQFSNVFFSIFDSWQQYDNIADYLAGKVTSLSLDYLLTQTPTDYDFVTNPNEFKDNVDRTLYLNNRFDKKIKQHKLNDLVFNEFSL